MKLFPIHTTTITLPDLLISTKRIGNNRVVRFGFKSQYVKVDVFESQRDGLYSIKTVLPNPYNYIYLRKPRKRPSLPDTALCLEFKNSLDITAIDISTQFRWYQHPLLDEDSTPEEIRQSWADRFQFKKEQPDIQQEGLRIPQLGALHAMSAYFSVDRHFDPVTVVLPTGTGKTETMLSSLIYWRIPKLLVLVPSTALRNQISGKFMDLGYLPGLGVTPFDIALPSVAVIKKSLKSVNEANELLESANVVVATVSILRSSDQGAVDSLCGGCTHLFVDEAHHLSAVSWSAVRDRFTGKCVVQFTATPFRNDGNALGGRIIYNFMMGEAQKAGYFRHIRLVPVEEYYVGEGDRVIAEEALAVLREDLEAGHDHLLMARVEKKARADEVAEIYRKLAIDLNPIIVYSNLSQTVNRKALDALFSRKSRIVVCVNMLGEGFDLPNLKVAAVHDSHKSLPITLQFIGRFTRQAKDVGDASVIVNVAEPEVETELQRLYAQGADWDSVLRRLSEKRIDREIRLEEVVETLKEKGTLHDQISLWNLRPSFSAMLFRTTCHNWCPERFEDALPKCSNHWYAISETERLLVVLAIYDSPVKWGHYKGINDSIYKLLVAHWDKDRSALFVYSNDYQWYRVEKLTELLCDGSCELLSGPRIFNVFNGVEYPLVRNLGASKIGAISFTQYFGPNVTEGLSSIEASESHLSNLAGLGYEDGERVIWGCSQKKGKVWSVNSGPISDWCEWVKKAWDKIGNGEADEANITRDFLRPKRINRPYREFALCLQWGEHALSEPEDRVTIIFGNREVPLYLVDLNILGRNEEGSYLIAISTEGMESVYTFRIDDSLSSGYEYGLHKGKPVTIQRGRGAIKPIEEYLIIDPWVIHYVDGSYSYNCYLIKVSQEIGQYDIAKIDDWDWHGIDITKESMGRTMRTDTVQYRAFELIADQYDVVLNDDGTGEAADLVCLKVLRNTIVLCLVHCKYSSDDTPGRRIKDLYEVCGQAQKSIRWKHGGIPRLVDHLRRREAIWKDRGDTRFLKGSLSDLVNMKRLARTASLRFHVLIVQPGLKASTASPEMLRILGSTELYLKNTSQADFGVIGSER